MSDQWSSYYQGQAAPQPSTSASYDYGQPLQPQMQYQQQQTQQQQHAQHSQHQQQSPSQMQPQQHQPMSATMPPHQRRMQSDPSGYLMPQVYTGDPALSLSMRSGTSSSISSSVSSASGHPSPTSMRTSMSSSTTGRTPSTPSSSISLASPFFTTKDLSTQESWFGSLQDSFLSSQQAPSYDSQEAARPALYRMDRMSIAAHTPTATQQSTWHHPSMSPQQRTPRRASIATFPVSPTHQSPSYVTQHVTFNPQPSYQSPPQQTVSYTQPMQTWNQSSSMPVFQPNYAYQIAPPSDSNTTIDMHASYGPSSSTDTDMRSSMSHSYYPSSQNPTAWQQSSTSDQMPPLENYNFAGVLLDAEDLHLLGPDPLSPTAPPVQSSYRATKPGWQPTFSFGTTETTPKAVQQATMQSLPRQQGSISEMQPNWNFASFHGFTPLTAVATSQPLAERAASAPPPKEIQPVQMPNSLVGEDMNRRRGSSVDSPSMVPFQFDTFPPALSPPRTSRRSYQSSPVYLGRGPAKLGHSSTAARRATVGPSSLDVPSPSSSQSVPLAHSGSMDHSTASPKSAPIPPSVPTSPTRRRGNRRSMAPMFINFTTKDAKKLLSGVAPSGSSKRKREEEEAARDQAKHVKFEAGIKEDSAEVTDSPLSPT